MPAATDPRVHGVDVVHPHADPGSGAGRLRIPVPGSMRRTPRARRSPTRISACCTMPVLVDVAGPLLEPERPAQPVERRAGVLVRDVGHEAPERHLVSHRLHLRVVATTRRRWVRSDPSFRPGRRRRRGFRVAHGAPRRTARTTRRAASSCACSRSRPRRAGADRGPRAPARPACLSGRARSGPRPRSPARRRRRGAHRDPTPSPDPAPPPLPVPSHLEQAPAHTAARSASVVGPVVAHQPVEARPVPLADLLGEDLERGRGFDRRPSRSPAPIRPGSSARASAVCARRAP